MSKSKSNTSDEIFDLCIIGGGPAGVSAGVYAARKKIKTAFITGSFDSQSTVSDNIQNWIGTVSISGAELTKNLEKHLRAYAEDTVAIKIKEKVTELSKAGKNFKIKTNKSEYQSRTVLITTGSVRKKLEIKGADKYENKGIMYCATCDAPLFSDMDVAVIGGGNAGFESALQLAAYAKSVTILQRSHFRADPVTIKKVLENPKVKGLTNLELLEIKGDKFVTGISYKERDSGKKVELPVKGIFVEIGSIPSVDFIKNGIVDLNARNEILVEPKNQSTTTEGIWAAGDCTDGLYKQNNIAVGDAIKAIENIFYYLNH